MVSKRSMKSKGESTNKRKPNNSSNKNTEIKKTIFISQKIITDSIFDKSLIDRNVQVELPPDLMNVFTKMISDASFIDETLNKKDHSFYNCNMTFFGGEEMISEKRRALVELMTEKKDKMNEMIDKLRSEKRSNKTTRRVKRKSMKFLIDVKKENREIDVTEIVSINNETDLELTDNRPQRKRKQPSKYKNDISINSEESVCKNSEQNNETDEKEVIVIGNNEEKSSEMSNIKSTVKKKSKFKKIEELKIQVIDLVEENSSDSSDNNNNNKLKLNANGDRVVGKSKIYFRDPIIRKSTKPTNKFLKEHTLLDKILLGINCVRKWTDKGLHLSRLCESDLGLLNKRLASLDCILADLEEHTDENNNRYLSVLLKSDLFSSFVVSASSYHSHQQKPVETNPSTATNASNSIPTKESINQQISSDTHSSENSVPGANYNRPKSKPHVPAMYRQRHAIPSILSKPFPVKQTAEDITTNGFHVYQDDQISFLKPVIKFEEQLSPSASGSVIANSLIENNFSSDTPKITASQLLRQKFKKTNCENSNQTTAYQTVSDASTCLTTSVPPTHFKLSNGGISKDCFSQTSLIYHNISNANKIQRSAPLPLFILPNAKLISSSLHNNQKQTIHIPVSKAYHTVTKLHRLPVPNKSGLTNVPVSLNSPRITEIPSKNNSISSQSVVLKNLLQQSTVQMMSPHAISSSQMVPLSVFQNSQNKRQYISYNQHSFQK